MKRTVGTIVVLAGLGGCTAPDGATKSTKATRPFNTTYKGVEVPGVVGPNGEPIHMTSTNPGVTQASATATADGGVQQAAGFARIGKGASASGECADCNTGIHTPGVLGKHMGGGHSGAPYDPYAAGPMGSAFGTYLGRNGIMPVPQMGPPGAVALAPGAGMPMGPVASNMRTSTKFVNPQGMKVTWLGPNGYIEPGLTAPANYNFLQGNVYRLKLSGIAKYPGKIYYPTLEIAAATPKTMTYLAHSTVPIAFTDDDFERANAGSLVMKVIYLPDAAFQDLAAIAGAEEVVSTQLQPGEDPVVEATRRGTILATIRFGNIDLENPYSPAMDAPPGGGAARPIMSGPPAGMMMPSPSTPLPTPTPAPVPVPGGAATASPKAPASLPTLVKGQPVSLKK